MDSIEFYFPFKPFSINSMYYRNRSIITTEARNWQSSVLRCIEDISSQKRIKEFKDYYDPKINALEIEVQSYYLESDLITKNGTLSSKTFDLSNVEKPIIDLLTSKTYSTEICSNLEIDDKNCIRLISLKGIANEPALIVIVRKINKSELPRLKID